MEKTIIYSRLLEHLKEYVLKFPNSLKVRNLFENCLNGGLKSLPKEKKLQELEDILGNKKTTFGKIQEIFNKKLFDGGED